MTKFGQELIAAATEARQIARGGMKFPSEFMRPIASHPKTKKPCLGFDENASRKFQYFVMVYDQEHERFYTTYGDYVKPSHWLPFDEE